MRTLKLTIAYDGTSFVGWQRQAAGVSIQGLIEEAFARLEGGAVAVIGAGRTDAGVHALGQVASVRVGSPHDERAIRRALNAALPPEVRVLAVEVAPDGFHARYSAIAKTYQYWIATGEVTDPFFFRYVWQLPSPLDVDAMDSAARLLEGRHDFSAFRSTGGGVTAAERTIYSSRVVRGGGAACRTPAALAAAARGFAAPEPAAAPSPGEAAGDLIGYEIRGEGFLRHMVRAIVGTLVEVGAGRRQVSDVTAILTGRDRAGAGPTAPASGLVLVSVDYR